MQHVAEDHHFTFRPSAASSGDSSLMVRTLSIDADSIDGLILWIEGYSPRIAGRPFVLTAPDVAEEARLALDDPSLLLPGAGRALHRDDDWLPRFDQANGLFEMRLRTSAPSRWFRITTGTVIGLDDGREIAAVQLTPELV